MQRRQSKRGIAALCLAAETLWRSPSSVSNLRFHDLRCKTYLMSGSGWHAFPLALCLIQVSVKRAPSVWFSLLLAGFPVDPGDDAGGGHKNMHFHSFVADVIGF